MMIPFTPAEAQVLINLLDVAIRARGLEVAEAALEFARRAQAIIDAPSEAEMPPNPEVG